MEQRALFPKALSVACADNYGAGRCVQRAHAGRQAQGLNLKGHEHVEHARGDGLWALLRRETVEKDPVADYGVGS